MPAVVIVNITKPPANHPPSLASFPFPQMRKMRLKEVKGLAQCHPLIREGGAQTQATSKAHPPSVQLNEGFGFTLLSP